MPLLLGNLVVAVLFQKDVHVVARKPRVRIYVKDSNYLRNRGA
jgi:hypothetical protein